MAQMLTVVPREPEVAPCHCTTAEEAKTCNRAGLNSMGTRLFELCSNKCPAQRPCKEGLSEAYRKLWDSPEYKESRLMAQQQESLPQKPSLFQKAASLTKSMMGWVGTGFKTRTEKEQEAILDICRKCDKFNPTAVSCSLCGCNMPLKVRLANSKCPDNPPKWE
jgi:hypothetical protein